MSVALFVAIIIAYKGSKPVLIEVAPVTFASAVACERTTKEHASSLADQVSKDFVIEIKCLDYATAKRSVFVRGTENDYFDSPTDE
jgi:hypothetical protein